MIYVRTSLEYAEAPSSPMLPEEQEHMIKKYGIMQLVTAGHGTSVLLGLTKTNIFNHCAIFAGTMLSDFVPGIKRKEATTT